MSARRKRFAIYRLYRYLDLTPKEIAQLVEEDFEFYEDKIYVPPGRGNTFYHRVYNIRDIIGEVFSELCIQDKKCVFRKFLKK